MLKIPEKAAQSHFQQDLDKVLEGLEDRSLVLDYKNELFAVWYASPFIKRVCVSQPNWLYQLLVEKELQVDFDIKKYQKILQPVFSNADSVELLQQQLRQKRVAAFARIAWRDLQEYTNVKQTLYELSAFAEACVNETLRWCFQWLQSRSHSSDYIKTLRQNIIVFALGKLGGGELNFSSDIDIVFAYAEDKENNQEVVGQGQAGKATEFYLRVIQLFIKVLSEQTQDGFVFRVDTRLRPFGDSGTLIPSLFSIDQYFQTHGRDWERYAWMKARVIAGEIQIGEHFLEEITPFIYRRYLDYGAIQSLREMKELIDVKARQDSAKENLKVGFGGIREIEFIAQMFQLIYGGKDSSLRLRSTQQALKQLEKQGLLKADWVLDLSAAYLFLRKAENGLQLREDQQIHTLPTDELQQSHFAYLMGMQDWQGFYAQYKNQTDLVNSLYQSLLKEDKESKDNSSKNDEFEKLWLQIREDEFCLNILNKYFIEDAQHIYEQLNKFSQTSLVQKLVPVARARLDEFVPIFLLQLLDFNAPSIVFDRFLNILKKIVQRSTYISLLIENKSKLSRIFTLIQSSPWISQYLATHPLLLDEILRMDENYVPPTKLEMQQQLSATLISDDRDLEKYMESLREFKHSQVIQIAAADVVEDYPIMKVSDHLSWLAETCLASAVSYTYRELIAKYGEPQCVLGNQIYTPEILIIEYGKLGGLELGYGSDLDIVFLHNSEGTNCETCGTTKGSGTIHNDVFFTRLVQRAIHILTTVTAGGKVFEIDLRLRPHGESGPVVSPIHAYEEYLINDAWMWEHQALVRARVVTASEQLQDKFENIRQKVLSQSRKEIDVQAAIIEMRDKMLSANGVNPNGGFNIKKDKGGVVDIEFIVQFLVLSYSKKYPQICQHTDNVRILDACADVGLLELQNTEELKEIYLKYRKYLHELSLELLPEIVDSNVFAQERRVVQKYWSRLLHSDLT